MQSVTRRVYINGRFLTQRTTGVQRFAREILRALDRELAMNSVPDESWTLLAPVDASPPDFDLKSIAFTSAGKAKGHIWEQSYLPMLSRNGFLFNFANSGPIFHSRSCVVIHDAAVFRCGQNYRPSYRYVHQTLGRVLAHTAQLVTVSEFSRRELSEVLRLDPDRITVTPNGCEHLQRVLPDRSIVSGLGLSPRSYFLFVGSPAPHKNVETAIAAFREAALPGIKLVLCGSAKAAVFGNSIASESSDDIVFARDLSDSAIAALYQAALGFVFPSRYEGFGIPPLEALVHDCPVLAADIPPCREVLGDAALFFAPDDVTTLSALMSKLYSSPDTREHLIARGRDRRLLFSWSASANRLLSVLRPSNASQERT